MKTSYRKAIERADEWFSKFVRLNFANDQLMVRCATKGTWHHVKEITLGHYMSRRHLNTRWTLENCLPQSVQGNYFHSGEQQKMALALDECYGPGTAQKMEIKALSRGQKLTEIDIRFVADFWRKEFNELLEERKIKSPWKSK